MTPPSPATVDQKIQGEHIRVRGLVQGVGFRPAVWRLANDCGLSGDVLNDGQGVLIRAWGTSQELDEFVERLQKEGPVLARIDSIDRTPLVGEIPQNGFNILDSRKTSVQTSVVPDAASCPECVEETLSPLDRRYRYPFTNCTHCGPRLSIIRGIPYDRHNTSMAEFPLCVECAGEYENPADRRFHAQPVACHVCGPRAWLERSDGRVFSIESLTQLDDVDAACTVLQNGEILALKGIGGFHLACDATNANAVAALRKRKGRYHKPFALMARTLEIIQKYCTVGEEEKVLLQSPASPIVLLPVHGPKKLPAAVAPGLNQLGFMLPYTPLHHLLLKRMDRPIVLTSGNFSDEPQCTDNQEARTRLRSIADYLLLNDRDIVNRVDDSVVRIMGGKLRILRRARGVAPAPLPLPSGFEQAPEILALGGELKNTFCLIKNGQAVLSQHIGDLENAVAFTDYQRNIELYLQLYQHRPSLLVVDKHPEYLSTKHGKSWADREKLQVETVQHHHAHIASCLAENNLPLDTPPVLGITLDGLGFGEDGTLWGGEFLLADYHQFKRLAAFKPVPMIGGTQAMREPWRNTFAQILTGIGWDQYKSKFQNLELTRFLESQPLDTLQAMLVQGINCPPASSCGRLFDAVAAAIGVCRKQAGYEGQAAMALEAIVDNKTLKEESDDSAYPFSISSVKDRDLFIIEPVVMWIALLDDLLRRTPAEVMAARFHKGLAKAIVAMVLKLTQNENKRFINTLALSGGVWQNQVLLEQVLQRLREKDYNVLTQSRVPANDGGLSLGQAIIGAARQIKKG
jgi:hydrogenase maturation protein HypF